MSNKTDTIKMKQTVKRELKPKLRFPEFKNAPEWEEKRLDEMADIIGGGTPDVTIKAYWNDGIAWFTPSEITQKYLGKSQRTISELGLRNSSAKILPVGALLLSTRATIGEVGIATEICTTNQGFQSLIAKKSNEFLYYWIKSHKNEFLRRASGSTFLEINKSEVSKIVLYSPSLLEQQKIADCLSSIDELITAQAQKLETLKAHKKGLMQQLFPAEGETLPKLRFPEFKNAPEWEEKKLGKICDILNSRRQPISSSDRKQGSYPYYGASGIIDFINDYIFDERLLLIGEDGAKWGAFEKTAFIVEGKYWVNNHAHVLKTTQVSDTLLENYLIMLDISPFITGAAPPKLTLGKLKEIPIPVPISIIEQQKIADCLSSVDELITAQAQKLEMLKAHKKGLMQQLFPAPEEVME